MDSVDVTVLGGRLLARQSVMLDDSTIAAVGSFDVDVALLGAEAFDASGAWNSHNDVAALQRAVMARSKMIFLCVDAEKLGRRGPALLATWDEPIRLITDATRAALAEHDIPLKRGRHVPVEETA